MFVIAPPCDTWATFVHVFECVRVSRYRHDIREGVHGGILAWGSDTHQVRTPASGLPRLPELGAAEGAADGFDWVFRAPHPRSELGDPVPRGVAAHQRPRRSPDGPRTGRRGRQPKTKEA